MPRTHVVSAGARWLSARQSRQREPAPTARPWIERLGWFAGISAMESRLFDRESFFTDQLPAGILFEGGYGYRALPPWLGRTWRVIAAILDACVLITAPFGAVRLFRLARGPALLA
ncbi:MAG: hypothetical protein ABIX28_19860 [Vicinamibacterales bacterium]